jgi:quinol monooxygenase YgiN
MIIVHGQFPILKEQQARAHKLMQEMAAASRLETGCVSYEFYAALTNPCKLLLFQEWESVEALQDHFETDHMEIFLTHLPEILAGEIVTRRYEVRHQKNASVEEEVFTDEREDARPETSDPQPKIIH